MLYKTISYLLFLVFLTGKISAQIYSPAAADSFPASYNLPGGTDKVFIVNVEPFQGIRKGSLTAVSTDRITGWDFEWSVYSPVLQAYTALPGITDGMSSVIDTISVSSGYQVKMTKGAVTEIFRVWMLFNDFQVEITNKDASDSLLFGYFNCASLDLIADTTSFPLFYINPVTHARIRVFNNYSIRWSTDNSEASIPASRLITRVNNPPSVDTWYRITLTDRFDLMRSDSVFYKSIQPNASLVIAYVNLGDSAAYPEKYGSFYNDNILSAPGKYSFDFSASKNAVSYEIKFGDGELFETGKDTVKTVHEYKTPGKYKAVLFAKGEKPFECIDSVSREAELVYALFRMPKAFSPNNDGNNDLLHVTDNDIFRSEDISVVTIDITIFDRAGRKVHEYAGNIRDWSGWNGNVMQSDRQAPEGVYFYAISLLYAFEDENKPIGKQVQKGFIHLFRE